MSIIGRMEVHMCRTEACVSKEETETRKITIKI